MSNIRTIENYRIAASQTIDLHSDGCEQVRDIVSELLTPYQELARQLAQDLDACNERVTSHERRITTLEQRVDSLLEANSVLSNQSAAMSKIVAHLNALSADVAITNVEFVAMNSTSEVFIFSSIEKLERWSKKDRELLLQYVASGKEVVVDDEIYKLYKYGV
jgi:uncharacterized coiled-coil protein SlyX